MLCLFEQDFLKYYTKAGMDTEELEVGVPMSHARYEVMIFCMQNLCFFRISFPDNNLTFDF